MCGLKISTKYNCLGLKVDVFSFRSVFLDQQDSEEDLKIIEAFLNIKKKNVTRRLVNWYFYFLI